MFFAIIQNFCLRILWINLIYLELTKPNFCHWKEGALKILSKFNHRKGWIYIFTHSSFGLRSSYLHHSATRISRLTITTTLDCTISPLAWLESQGVKSRKPRDFFTPVIGRAKIQSWASGLSKTLNPFETLHHDLFSRCEGQMVTKWDFLDHFFWAPVLSMVSFSSSPRPKRGVCACVWNAACLLQTRYWNLINPAEFILFGHSPVPPEKQN